MSGGQVGSRSPRRTDRGPITLRGVHVVVKAKRNQESCGPTWLTWCPALVSLFTIHGKNPFQIIRKNTCAAATCSRATHGSGGAARRLGEGEAGARSGAAGGELPPIGPQLALGRGCTLRARAVISLRGGRALALAGRADRGARTAMAVLRAAVAYRAAARVGECMLGCWWEGTGREGAREEGRGEDAREEAGSTHGCRLGVLMDVAARRGERPRAERRLRVRDETDTASEPMRGTGAARRTAGARGPGHHGVCRAGGLHGLCSLSRCRGPRPGL